MQIAAIVAMSRNKHHFVWKTAVLMGICVGLAQAASTRPPDRNEAPISLPLKAGTMVTVLAPTRSTSETAHKVVESNGWIVKRTTYMAQPAQIALVVVRSSKSSPLAIRYEDSRALRKAVNQCPNENGPLIHTYLYIYFRDEGAYIIVEHSSAKAEENGKSGKP